MSKQALQQRLAQHSGLLVSQHQLLQRLLLQLEFNQPDRLQLVGGSGSGKSTLILSLADICSAQFNMALLQASPALAPVDVLKVLQQQWFGAAAMPRTLADFTAQLGTSEQYLLLIDDADQLPEASWQLIQQLPVSVFVSALKAKADIRLAMNIPPFGEDEAATLLAPFNLPGREVRERIEDCAGDLHLLLHGLGASFKPQMTKSKPIQVENTSSDLAFSAKADMDPPVFVAQQNEPHFDLTAQNDTLAFRATDSQDEEPSLRIDTEQGSDYRQRTAQVEKPAKKASGQFFSPFLVMSLGFGAIAAVVMFWLWTEQQFRQPVATDMVPSYPAQTARSTEARLQQQPDAVPQADNTGSAVAQTTTPQPVAQDQGMPEMAMGKTDDTTAMTVQAEVAKDENGLPQKQIVSMTIESEPMREQPVITAVPEQSQDAEPPAPDTAEAVAETVPESKQQQVAEAAGVTETAADQDELLAEMAADTAETAPAPTTTAATSAQFDAQALLAMLPDTVAIQLGVFSQEAAAKKFLQQYSTLNLQLYQRQQQGKTQFVVVSASYVNGAAARQQVKSLPEELRQQTPFVKALSDIQREIQSSNAR